ncbi:hypothetical protein BWR15_14685 [Pseudomonas sp. T]|nr:hypothetical protein BWR15_14685 [Pseudomonas sp. T]
MTDSRAISAQLKMIHSTITDLAEGVMHLACLLDGSIQPHDTGSPFLTEEKMAERLGLSRRALESKRSKKLIPEGSWMKHGGRIIYNVQAYDDWMEGEWQKHLRNVSAITNRPRNGKQTVRSLAQLSANKDGLPILR